MKNDTGTEKKILKERPTYRDKDVQETADKMMFKKRRAHKGKEALETPHVMKMTLKVIGQHSFI